MTTKQEIEINAKFLEELHSFVRDRINNRAMAHGGVCSLTLLATQMAQLLNNGDLVATRDMMVSALNLALKHGLATAK